MRSIIRIAHLACVLVASTVLAGCATDVARVRPIKKHWTRPANDNVAKADDAMYRKCQQRHIEHRAGTAPWNAKDLAQKKEDDRLCELSYKSRQ